MYPVIFHNLKGNQMDTILDPKIKSRDLFLKNKAWFEGVGNGLDNLGIYTLDGGVVYDLDRNPTATKANIAIATSLGITLNKLTSKDDVEKVAAALYDQAYQRLVIAIPEFKTLSPNSQMILVSRKYNTGQSFKNQAKCLAALERDPSNLDLLEKAIHEGRTSQLNSTTNTKEYAGGLDNRVVKEFIAAGYVSLSNIEQVTAVKKALPLFKPHQVLK